MARRSPPPRASQNADAAQQARLQEQPATLYSAGWSGPLPPPGALEHFNQIIPNGAERIMSMVEHEQAHRHVQEAFVVGAEVRNTTRGQWLGAGISIAGILGAVGTSLMHASPFVSVALVGLPIAAIVQAIVRRQPKN